MGIINVLDKHTANLIAAGEVVERPSSAVKEMLENCADAGAKNITVEIKDGGTSFIRISDDGCGISRDDVPKTILRHATSKIKTGSDLESIGTLGFRGEALAAIAAVSELRIMTKRPEDDSGTLFMCSFGEVISTEDVGCPDGTTIIAENLFENTPARRKFLKKNSTEASAVFAVCEKFALSKPDIAVKLISDGAVKLHTPGDGNLKNAIYACIGKDFANSLLDVEYTLGNVRVFGFIGKPEICRPNRNMQNFFVNGRYIKSRTMLAALEEGFRGFCPTGKFPTCVLFLQIRLDLVDVNIHPAKLEIKFSDDRAIFDCVYFAVKNSLSQGISNMFSYTRAVSDNIPVEFLKKENDSNKEKQISQQDVAEKTAQTLTNNIPVRTPDKKVPDIQPAHKEIVPEKEHIPETVSDELVNNDKKTCGENAFADKLHTKEVDNTVIDRNAEPIVNIPGELRKQQTIQETTPLFSEPVHEPVEKKQILEQQELIPKKELLTVKYIGEIFDTYIVVERGECMYMIDKHAAHERIIYERIKHASDNNDSQYLLEPIAVSLTPKEYEAVRNNTAYYTQIGFDFEEFGPESYLIRSKPTGIDMSDVKDVFTFLAGKLADGNLRSQGEIFDRALYTAACKAAIKAGNQFTEKDNMRIINEIFENDAVLYCPHGRPVLTEFTKERIEKLFGRL